MGLYAAMNGLRHRAIRLSGWRRFGLAFLLGALADLSFAPFHLVPVWLVSITGLLWLLEGAGRLHTRLWIGWAFGWGHFIFGLYWIGSAFLVEPEKFAWLLPFPVLGLPALLALFPMAAIAATGWYMARATGGRRLLVPLMLAAAWVAAELVRGTVLTGFPWNLAGYGFGFHPAAMRPAAWIGAQGLSLIVIAAAAAPWLVSGCCIDGLQRQARQMAVVLLALPVLLVGGGMLFAGGPESDRSATTLRVRVVQANIAQKDKWRRDLMGANFHEQLRMSLAGDGGRGVDIVIWPETAATFLLSEVPAARQQLGAVAASLNGGQGGLVIVGAPRVERGSAGETDRFYNSAVAIDSRGQIVATVDKHHLVPFGEYLPARNLLQQIGLDKLAQGRGDFVPGPAGGMLDLPGIGPARVLVCYEAIFPVEAMVAGGVGRGAGLPVDGNPGWLLNLTNDGWFGGLTGPDQHFAMARFRAVEQRRPLIRAAGTGISAIIDADGQIVAAVGLQKKGVIDGEIGRITSKSFYASWRNLPLITLVVGILAVLSGCTVWSAIRHRPPKS